MSGNINGMLSKSKDASENSSKKVRSSKQKKNEAKNELSLREITETQEYNRIQLSKLTNDKMRQVISKGHVM